LKLPVTLGEVSIGPNQWFPITDIMSTVVLSFPADPAQPNQAVFSTDLLQTFQSYTRASYLAAFSVQAPSFDSTLPEQSWFDSTAAALTATQEMSYWQIQLTPSVDGSTAPAQVVPLTIPAGQAATPNIPGVVTYPPYIVAPTTAQSGPALVTPTILSDYSDALAMAAALGLPVSSIIMGVTLTWNQETRRTWEIVVPGNPNPYYVGDLLGDQYANGIGSPGAWSIQNPGTSMAGPVWTPVPQGPDGISNPPTSATPIPIRALLANEKLVPAGLGGGVMVARTDLASPSVLGTLVGFSQQDAVMLAAIYAALVPADAA
jgi:hypothetical protein